MEKIGINIVGVGPSSEDVSTQLFNVNGGFRSVNAKIVCRDADSLYLGIISTRVYDVRVEGDLVLSTETSDSIGSKTDGVTGFDIDWTLTAKQFGNGSGKIIVTNPDAPSEVSTFEVFMGEPRSIVVDVAANTGCVEIAICEDAWPVLIGSRNFSPRGDLDLVQLATCEDAWPSLVGSRNFSTSGEEVLTMFSPDAAAAIRRSFEALIVANNSGRSDMSNNDRDPTRVLAHEFGHDFGQRRKGTDPRVDQYSGFGERQDHNAFWDNRMPLLVFGDFNEGGTNPHYHRPEDFCRHAPSVECLLVDALVGGLGIGPKAIGVGSDLTQPSDHLGLVYKLTGLDGPAGLVEGPVLVRATLEDLMASFGPDENPLGDGIEVEGDVRDFNQLARTRSNDQERIERAVAAAGALGIDTSNVASRRDAALAKLVVFSDRFETGGNHAVTEAEAAVINEVFGELWSIHSELDQLVSHWHHYKQHKANHDGWEARLADRKRNFKLADDAGDNRIATSYVEYAAKPEETLAASKAAFVELFQAVQKGDLRAAHQADTRARQFSTREHLLDALIRRGKLVVVEDVATTD